MPNKKHEKKTDMLRKEKSTMRQPKTYDDMLSMQMEKTIASVVKTEIYPRGNEAQDKNEKQESEEPPSKKEYLKPNSPSRYTQDPYTVAQNFIDRTQFIL